MSTSDDEIRRELSEDSEDVVLVRRIDRRLDEYRKGDWPWLRRIVGGLIIAASFYLGWKMLDQRTNLTSLPRATVSSSGASDKVSKTAHEPIGNLRPLTLDAATVNTISDCTKGVDAFRQIDLSPDKIARGEMTLELIFAPVLSQPMFGSKPKRTVNLQNTRIRTKAGEELRLHVTPGNQKGELGTQLFRVAKDGLPEPIPFPPEIANLEGQLYSDQVQSEFLKLSETPGQALEIERHESWSYSDKSGIQLIWSGDSIQGMQVFMHGRFLACSRSSRSESASIACKCVESSHR